MQMSKRKGIKEADLGKSIAMQSAIVVLKRFLLRPIGSQMNVTFPIIRDFVAVSVQAKNAFAVRSHELIMKSVRQDVTASALPIVSGI